MNKKDLFQIGEVAKLFHISISSLRHYEKIGLLSPEYTDPRTGYRYYSTRQFECLNTIRYLRALDTPLDQISDFLKNRNLNNIQNILEQQKNKITEKIEELEIVKKKIDNRLYQLNDAIQSETDEIKISKSPKRRIAWIRHNISIETYLDLEVSIRQLEENQHEAVAFLGKVGVGISEENLNNRKFSEYDKVFLILDDEDVYHGKTVELPESTCITVRFRGSHKEAPEQYQKLIDFIIDNNMQITGFSSEVTMIDYGYTNDTDKFVTEIQIPVKQL